MKTITTIKVRGYHADMFGHVNHARYLEFLEEGRWSHFEEKGLFDVFHRENIGHVVVNININYRKSASPGDTVRIETGLLRSGNTSVIFLQEVFLADSDTRLVDAEITDVFFCRGTGKTIAVNPGLTEIWPDLAELHKRPGS